MIVSSNLFFNSSSLIASKSFAVSPKESLSEIFVIIEKRISCKYFQIVSRVLFEISGVFHTSLKLISGKKFTLTLAVASSLSFLKISAFLYKISKKRAGYTVLEYSYNVFTLPSSNISSATTLPSVLTETTTKLSFSLSLYSGKVVVKSFIKSVITFLNSSGTTSGISLEFDLEFVPEFTFALLPFEEELFFLPIYIVNL